MQTEYIEDVFFKYCNKDKVQTKIIIINARTRKACLKIKKKLEKANT